MAELTPAEVDLKTDALFAEAEAYFMGDGGVHNAATAIAGAWRRPASTTRSRAPSPWASTDSSASLSTWTS